MSGQKHLSGRKAKGLDPIPNFSNDPRIDKKEFKEILLDAIASSHLRHGKHIIEHAVETAYVDNDILRALLNKLLPEKIEFEKIFRTVEEKRLRIERIAKIVQDISQPCRNPILPTPTKN